MSGSPSPPAAQAASILSKTCWLPRSSTVTLISGCCLLKPSSVDFSADAATFQLQMVRLADSAYAEPDASSASAAVAPISLKRIENPPFSIAVPKRTRLDYLEGSRCLLKREC